MFRRERDVDEAVGLVIAGEGAAWICCCGLTRSAGSVEFWYVEVNAAFGWVCCIG